MDLFAFMLVRWGILEELELGTLFSIEISKEYKSRHIDETCRYLPREWNQEQPVLTHLKGQVFVWLG